VHSETGCSTPLSKKVDPAPFTMALTAAAPAAADSERGRPAPAADEALTARLRAGLAAAVDAVVSPEQAEAFHRRLEDAADPVVALVPMLESRTRQEQVETLAWVLATGREKLAAALAPGLVAPDRLTPAEGELAAAKLLGVAASLLEEEGFTASEIESLSGD